jgi:glucans biosynthesis protein C
MKMERHYGLDWLRIGAFALLIFYHIGMFFVPWDWHVKTAEPLRWAEIPMLATNAWRLGLLFLISGVASRFLLDKMAAPGAFARQRSVRLLIPLAAGIILFVAPQPWAELQAKAGYAYGFWHFWTQDYFRFGVLEGIVLPTYNHLWFVAYLWVYTLLIAAGATLLPAAAKAALQAGFDRLFAGARLLWVPILLVWLARVTLYPIFEETHALVDDWYNHAVYGGLFLFGLGVAKSEALWRAVVALWKPAAALALLGYVGIVLYNIAYQDGDMAEPWLTLMRGVRAAHMWGAIVALLALARLRLDRDSPARRYLTEAIFPYYIAHQTIIVLVGHALTPLALGPAVEFAIILPATVVGCALTYEVARRVPAMGPLLGLKGRQRAYAVAAPVTS